MARVIPRQQPYKPSWSGPIGATHRARFQWRMGWRFTMKVLASILTTIPILFLVPSLAAALVFGGTDLGIFGYPDHTCSPPYSKPIKPYQFNTQWEIDQYNSEVDSYNYELETYLDCIREYVANSNNDIKRITEKANAAIDGTNYL